MKNYLFVLTLLCLVSCKTLQPEPAAPTQAPSDQPELITPQKTLAQPAPSVYQLPAGLTGRQKLKAIQALAKRDTPVVPRKIKVNQDNRVKDKSKVAVDQRVKDKSKVKDQKKSLKKEKLQPAPKVDSTHQGKAWAVFWFTLFLVAIVLQLYWNRKKLWTRLVKLVTKRKAK
ncbi:hypothetical protein AHMF7605_10495 [Adhaeribacter arboris]|uniref:DUF4349 domain-containing protein n=1 Tax=Adhaeribacter arboris TaxID=2072846 RepID=A0A2T2YEH1_9BACT|nr:hypothetical protein [Adhaeribacter arboris]PSR53915.1 hypothetical protein AHMF7605_10495 [Adhaeribacter arboris]